MIKRNIISKAEKSDEAKVELGVRPDKNGNYQPKTKGWRNFSGYLQEPKVKK